MKPDRALELVLRYSQIKRAIAACGPRICAEVEKCHGQNGYRHEVVHHPAVDHGVFGFIDAHDEPTERAMKEETHLAMWYSKDYGEWEGYDYRRFTVGDDGEDEQCPHCFAAHLIVQERKELRRQLGRVTSAMTRATPKEQTP